MLVSGPKIEAVYDSGIAFAFRPYWFHNSEISIILSFATVVYTWNRMSGLGSVVPLEKSFVVALRRLQKTKSSTKKTKSKKKTSKKVKTTKEKPDEAERLPWE